MRRFCSHLSSAFGNRGAHRIYRNGVRHARISWPGGGPTLHGSSAGRQAGVNQHIQPEESRIVALVRQHFGNLLDDLGERVKHREDALKAGGQIAGSE